MGSSDITGPFTDCTTVGIDCTEDTDIELTPMETPDTGEDTVAGETFRAAVPAS